MTNGTEDLVYQQMKKMELQIRLDKLETKEVASKILTICYEMRSLEVEEAIRVAERIRKSDSNKLIKGLYHLQTTRNLRNRVYENLDEEARIEWAKQSVEVLEAAKEIFEEVGEYQYAIESYHVMGYIQRSELGEDTTDLEYKMIEMAEKNISIAAGVNQKSSTVDRYREGNQYNRIKRLINESKNQLDKLTQDGYYKERQDERKYYESCIFYWQARVEDHEGKYRESQNSLAKSKEIRRELKERLSKENIVSIKLGIKI